MDPAMPDKTIATPSKSSARRALGELTPNAKLSPRKSHVPTDKIQPSRNFSPLKQARSLSHAYDENAKLPDQMAGRKRSIDDVDIANAREDATGAPARRVDGRAAAPMAKMQASAQLVRYPHVLVRTIVAC